MVRLRKLSRKMRIIRPVRQAAIDATVTTPLMAPFTKMDWSAKALISSAGGTVVLINGNRALIPAMMVRVDVLPFFCTVKREERCPFTRTMFVWGGKPSRTQATSLMYMVVLPIVLTGMRLSCAMVWGAALAMSTSYSFVPILDVPVGRIRFWAEIAVTTSNGERPFACKA